MRRAPFFSNKRLVEWDLLVLLTCSHDNKQISLLHIMFYQFMKPRRQTLVKYVMMRHYSMMKMKLFWTWLLLSSYLTKEDNIWLDIPTTVPTFRCYFLFDNIFFAPFSVIGTRALGAGSSAKVTMAFDHFFLRYSCQNI